MAKKNQPAPSKPAPAAVPDPETAAAAPAPEPALDIVTALKERNFDLDPSGTWRHQVHPDICCHPAAITQLVRLHGPKAHAELLATYDREIRLHDRVKGGMSYEAATQEMHRELAGPADPETAS